MWARVSAGVVPGFFLATALVGLISWLLPGPWESTMLPGLAAFFPIWLGVICLALRYASGAHAWGWLGALALSGLGLLWLLQSLDWVR